MEYRGYVRTPATEEFTWPDLPMLRSIVASTARTKEQKSQIKALLQKHGVFDHYQDRFFALMRR